MVGFPPGKINLGLYITSKRPDGYHNLETIFIAVDLRDAIECVPAGAGDTNLVELSISGRPIAGDPVNNLCVKAWHLLRRDFPQLPPVCMHIHKNIPMGAGMGGGSANGTYMLQLLVQQFQLSVNEAYITSLSLELGSDCPFFLHATPCFAKGRGEELSPISLPLEGYKVLLIHPSVPISTAEAFAHIQPEPVKEILPSLIQYPVEEWKERIHNQFENTVFKAHPHLAAYKKSLYDLGAAYASLTGSGSTIYGLFPTGTSQPTLPPHWPETHWVDLLLSSHTNK
ncbi:MAG: 4-(cytidine 5'-diphospho)-2-C-methyl-D-erythritol kinase [Chitinophagia bacterium]|nr:4-(cytidine 5'-diphospho)-2-C-methyl-D-erythritol kinase [Chitinophagia bacterium]